MVRGLLRSSYIGASAQVYVRHFSREGDFVSSMAALLAGQPSDYRIEALEPTLLITFPFREWRRLSEGSPLWGGLHRRFLEARLVRTERRERSLVLDDAETRYRQFRREHPGLEARLRQYDVASYLGITPVFLSRLRARPEK